MRNVFESTNTLASGSFSSEIVCPLGTVWLLSLPSKPLKQYKNRIADLKGHPADSLGMFPLGHG